MSTPAPSPSRKVRVGLHGTNGHQILEALKDHPCAEAVALSAFPEDKIPPWAGALPRHDGLGPLLDNETVDLVSLCSPRRDTQAAEALDSLLAGKHVLAEKPCALDESDLDRIIETAKSTGRIFHEMAGSAFEQPWREIGRLVREGAIGRVTQVFAQKSYPAHDDRPADPGVDGGLFLQAGIHAARWIEHGLGLDFESVLLRETRTPDGRLAAVSALCEFAGGASGLLAVNYLNPRGFPSWGNESLRVWGGTGMIEAVDGGSRTRLVTAEKDLGQIHATMPPIHWLDAVLDEILHGTPMPVTLERELHPLRSLLRAKHT